MKQLSLVLHSGRVCNETYPVTFAALQGLNHSVSACLHLIGQQADPTVKDALLEAARLLYSLNKTHPAPMLDVSFFLGGENDNA